MTQHLLRYIPWESLQHWKRAYAIERYAGSEQFDRLRVCAGDVIWGVSIPLEPGPDRRTYHLGKGLTLFGKLQIGHLTCDLGEIQRMMGTRDIWQASRFAVARDGTEAPYSEIDITDIAHRIRFESAKDRLAMHDGRIGAQQLQIMRRLTPDSALLLEAVWMQGRSRT